MNWEEEKKSEQLQKKCGLSYKEGPEVEKQKQEKKKRIEKRRQELNVEDQKRRDEEIRRIVRTEEFERKKTWQEIVCTIKRRNDWNYSH